MTDIEVGLFLKKKRIEKNWNQFGVVFSLKDLNKDKYKGFDKRKLSRIENGKQKAFFCEVVDILKVLEVDLSEIKNLG